MKISIKNIIIPLLIIVISSCQQQPVNKKQFVSGATDQKLTVKNMHDDLFILWSAIKEMHPGYGIYTTTDSLQRAYDKTYSSINTPLSESEFIDCVYPFLCNLHCGHTQIRHSVNYKPSPEGLKEPHLPFEVLVRHSQAWITTHQSDALNTGDELLSINNVPVADVIKHGCDLYCADGYNETFHELFLSEYDGFEDACFKYYRWTGPYRLKLLNPKGAVRTIIAYPAMKAGPWHAVKPVNNYINWTAAKNTGYLPLRFLRNSSSALFEVKTYEYSDTTIYKEAFKQIKQKGIKNLIIDIRHNTGGDLRIAIKLLSYLADSSYYIVKELKSRISDPMQNHFGMYFDTMRTASFISGFKPGYKEGKWYHIAIKPAFGKLYGKLPPARTDHFNGNLFVLIDGATFSSAVLFAAALKAQCKKAIFIGRETAGAEEGCNGATIQRLTLPNTHIVVEFPWMRVVSIAKSYVTGHGIMPSYYVDYTPEDVVNKTDPDLKKALTLIH